MRKRIKRTFIERVFEKPLKHIEEAINKENDKQLFEVLKSKKTKP